MARPKKKHKLKPIEPLPHIEGDFQIAAFDLSLRRPGYSLLLYHADTRSVELLRHDIVSNLTKTKVKKRGEILNEIGKLFMDYISPKVVQVVAREKSFTKFNAETASLNTVIGALEMILWDRKEMWFQEVAPMAVKRDVAGSGKASKEEIAEALDAYLEHPIWRSDDESDAVAVGIAWLIENGYMESIPLKKYEDEKRAPAE